MFIVIFYFLEFVFCELAKFHHIKLLGLNSVLALKRSLDGGSSVKWALFPSKKAEELLGFSLYFPQHVWQSYKEERIYNSPIQFSFTWETWKLGVSSHGFHHKHCQCQREDDRNPTSMMNENVLQWCITIAQPWACCIPCAGVSWSEMNTFKLPPLNAFLRPLIDFIQFSLFFFFNRMFEIEGTHVSHVQD